MTVITKRPDGSEIKGTSASLDISMLTIRCNCTRSMIRNEINQEPRRTVFGYLCKRCGNEIEILVPALG